MQVFLVGGAVRDLMLGLEPKDRDFVIVGGNAATLIDRGYEQVGMGFPVFLHPETREEYALARREKKVGTGYTGFEFEVDGTVSLRDDLSRRDLTINAMAIPEGVDVAVDRFNVIDHFGGLSDLVNKVLRHTSAAFAEDPLRVIRLARFFARYNEEGFTVAPETMTLASEMVDRGDLDELPFERFWLELEKVLSEKQPSKFFELLFEIGALQKVRFFKQLLVSGRWDGVKLKAITLLADACKTLKKEDRLDAFAAMACREEQPPLNFPTARSKAMYIAVNLYIKTTRVVFGAEEIATLLTRIDAFRVSQTPDDMLMALRMYEGIVGHKALGLPLSVFEKCMARARAVSSSMFPEVTGKELGAAIFLARVDVVKDVLYTEP